MRLQKITGRWFSFICAQCGARAIAGDGRECCADLDGEPFKAWFCETCSRELTDKQTSNTGADKQ